MIEIPTSTVGVTLLAVSAVLLGALTVFLPDLFDEGTHRGLRVVVYGLTWACALATALVSAVAGWALVTALKLEDAPRPLPSEPPARTEPTVPETTSPAEGTIPEVTYERTGSASAASSSSASSSAIPSSSASPSP
jgi:hypothetical protein